MEPERRYIFPWARWAEGGGIFGFLCVSVCLCVCVSVCPADVPPPVLGSCMGIFRGRVGQREGGCVDFSVCLSVCVSVCPADVPPPEGVGRVWGRCVWGGWVGVWGRYGGA